MSDRSGWTRPPEPAADAVETPTMNLGVTHESLRKATTRLGFMRVAGMVLSPNLATAE